MLTQHPRDDLGTGATVKTADGQVKSGDQLYQEGQAKKEDLASQGENGLEWWCCNLRVSSPTHFYADCTHNYLATSTTSRMVLIPKRRRRDT